MLTGVYFIENATTGETVLEAIVTEFTDSGLKG